MLDSTWHWKKTKQTIIHFRNRVCTSKLTI
uniref:Uncharacterized protein n=1 Tax=Rhizophora mucronata TaxID=61149 RepID=A0A2P2NVS6_RHIMU